MKASDQDVTKVGLPPIAQPDAQLFILGSLPGDASLAARRYYAHSTNQFWRLLGATIGEDLQTLGYEERLNILASRRIGLWDVIASARRPGSLDQAIRRAEHNRIDALFENYPALRAIAFNGGTAAKVGAALLNEKVKAVEVLELPSSSAANTMAFSGKLRAWSQLANWAGAKPLRGAYSHAG